MSFFSRKKKEEGIIPEFPRLPSEPSFPFYDEQLNDKKEDIMSKNSDFKMPVESFNLESQRSDFEKQNLNFEEFVPKRSPLSIERKDDKPLFVKVEKYRDSVKTINSIKSKLEEADSIIKNLSRLKEEEKRELQDWQSSLEEIKQKLLKIDKDLFEI